MGVFVVCEATGAHGCFVFLSGFLHAEEPSTPVEQNDSDLTEDV